MKTKWAQGKSNVYRIKLPLSIRAGIYSMIKGFLTRRDSLLRRIAVRCKLPRRASKRRPYLETLLSLDLPEELRKELLSLIRARDLIVYSIIALPQVKKLVREFIRTRIGEYCDPQGQIENLTIFSLAQGLDRMAPDKIGLRVDFLLANLERIVPGLQLELNTVSLVSCKRRAKDGPYLGCRVLSEEAFAAEQEISWQEPFY